MARSSVADMTIDELRELIKEAVAEAVSEILNDPDEGLTLREAIQTRRASLMSRLLTTQIDAPEDFAANHDLYAGGEKSAASAAR